MLLQRTKTESRHSVSLSVYELVYCRLPMTLSETSHGDFPHNIDARQTASRHSASLDVHKMVFCSLLKTLSSATLHWDFPHNVVGRMRDRPHLGTLLQCMSTKWCSAVTGTPKSQQDIFELDLHWAGGAVQCTETGDSSSLVHR